MNDSRRIPRPRAKAARMNGVETMIVIAVLLALVIAVLLTAPRSSAHVSTGSWTVGQGDTLWSIAKSCPVDGLSTAETVALLARINGLDASDIRPGERIRVPVTDEAVAMR